MYTDKHRLKEQQISQDFAGDIFIDRCPSVFICGCVFFGTSNGFTFSAMMASHCAISFLRCFR
jgi:hypothetical protein